MDITRHEGRRIIVTGAGSGIGQATVLRLAHEGAIVFGCDVDDSGLESTQQLLDGASLPGQLIQADIANQQDVDRVVAVAGPQIDALANVAGIMDHFLPLGELNDQTWTRVLDVNLTGVMRLSRAVLPAMQQAGRGSIVTVASKASLSGGSSGVAYAASKHGVIGLVRSVAYYYGPQGIRSNAVLPGPVKTNIGITSSPRVPWAMERAKLSMATMPAPAEPDQIAAVISWLACDEASDVNGALVTADGGWSTA